MTVKVHDCSARRVSPVNCPSLVRRTGGWIKLDSWLMWHSLSPLSDKIYIWVTIIKIALFVDIRLAIILIHDSPLSSPWFNGKYPLCDDKDHTGTFLLAKPFTYLVSLGSIILKLDICDTVNSSL